MTTTFHIGWPQGIWLALSFVRLIVHSARHGEATGTRYDVSVCAVGFVSGAAFLYWGGFFTAP
jgi:hypothetical protein